MSQFTAVVLGVPRPQGSGTALVSRSSGKIITKSPGTTAEWRNRLVAQFSEIKGTQGWEMSTGPVVVSIEFRFARPKSHSKVRRQTDGRYKDNGPDIDKLSRLVLDALVVARVLDDDRQVTDLHAFKRYVASDDEPEGAWVSVSEVFP